MERLVRVAKKLRTEHKFNGYIHLKTIPGASDELMKEAGLYADRLSVNIEMPTERSLALLAPEKNMQDMIKPMRYLSQSIIQHTEEKKIFKKAPLFAPAGQSTQMVIGATPETDFQILHMANGFYKKMQMRRVYYSGYIPISNDNRLPAIGTPVPMIREHRLYQADWLMRFYHFKAEEIVTPQNPLLEMDIDPKLQWALQNLHEFPLDINTADYHMIMRVPGIGVQSAQKICAARKHAKLTMDHLKNLGIQVNRAKYFIVCSGRIEIQDLQPQQIRQQILALGKSKYEPNFSPQLSLF
jgi:putative DNA modification/repair radical SAM protein